MFTPRFSVRSWRDQWVLFDVFDNEVLVLKTDVPRWFERANNLAINLTLGRVDKAYHNKWRPA